MEYRNDKYGLAEATADLEGSDEPISAWALDELEQFSHLAVAGTTRFAREEQSAW